MKRTATETILRSHTEQHSRTGYDNKKVHRAAEKGEGWGSEDGDGEPEPGYMINNTARKATTGKATRGSGLYFAFECAVT